MVESDFTLLKLVMPTWLVLVNEMKLKVMCVTSTGRYLVASARYHRTAFPFPCQLGKCY